MIKDWWWTFTLLPYRMNGKSSYEQNVSLKTWALKIIMELTKIRRWGRRNRTERDHFSVLVFHLLCMMPYLTSLQYLHVLLWPHSLTSVCWFCDLFIVFLQEPISSTNLGLFSVLFTAGFPLPWNSGWLIDCWVNKGIIWWMDGKMHGVARKHVMYKYWACLCGSCVIELEHGAGECL